MNVWAQVRDGAVAISMLLALAACESMPTAAPVIERSPNATSPVAKPAPATTPSSVAAAGKPANPAAVPAPTPLPPAPVPATATEKAPAPVAPEKPIAAVEEPTTKPYREGDWRPEFHVVKKGDTLYSIALDYGLDYRELAAWNKLEDPGLIKIDQRLRLFPPDSVGEAMTAQPTPLSAPVPVPVVSEPKARKLPYSEQALAQLKMPAPASPPGGATSAPPAVVVTGKPSPKPQAPESAAAAVPAREAPATDGKMVWEWPAQGKLLYGFGQGAIQKGIGIEGRAGQPVLAAGPGKVVYSGNGLRGYGKLIIVKHNATYLSVYAHNSRILVKEGQTVAKGQKIAEIGDTDSDRIALHFEIRRLGKPIDPMQYLPERS